MTDFENSYDISRRRLLTVFGGAAGLVTLAPHLGSVLAPTTARAATASAGDDYDLARATWYDILTGGDFDPTDPDIVPLISDMDDLAESYRALIDRSESREQVFVDQPLEEGDTAEAAGRVSRTFRRLLDMAMAYSTPGSRLKNDGDILADILAGLETANQQVYNEDQEEFGDYWSSWYNWEIAVPNSLTGTCTLVYDHLSADALARYVAAIDHFVADPRFVYPPDERHRSAVGSDRVALCLYAMLSGVLGRNNERILDAREALAEVFQYVTTGDGFHRDGTFIHHETVAYNGAYGVALLERFANLLALLAESPWQITGPEAQFVFDTVERSYTPVIFDNQMMDFVRGRNMSRWNERDHGVARLTIQQVLRLAPAADQPTADQWRAICKGWLERDAYEDVLTRASIPRTVLFKELMADSSVDPVPEPVNHTLYPSMDRAVHRRAGWAYAIAMCSKRISYYEHLSDRENVKGFHTGGGMTYLYDSDNSQFADEFWPTVDLYRLPGITVDAVRLPDAAGPGERPLPAEAAWVGGTTDGEFAAVGMDLEPLLSPLRAKKSWFCFDEYIVALGTSITRLAAQSRVETVVENRNLHTSGENALLIDGVAQPVESGWNGHFDDPSWAHLDGVGGYVFPAGGSVKVLREQRTGAWHDINTGGPEDPVTRHYLTMWFDHGTEPDDESYAYLLLPGASAARTAELADDPGNVRILANTNDVQAVWVPRLGITAANFWTAGSTHGITVDAPCSLLIRKEAGHLSVAVADPTQEQSSLSMTLVQPGYHSWTGDDTITVTELSPKINITVTLGPATATVTGTTPAWYELDVTGHIKRELAAGRTTVSLALRNPSITGPAIFASSREDGSNPPQLQINGTATHPAIADTYVRNGSFANTNFGEDTQLVLKTTDDPGLTRWTYLKFDLNGVDEVTSARLRLFAWLSSGTNPISTSAYPVADTSWSETGMTWNTKPAPTDISRSFGATHTATFQRR